METLADPITSTPKKSAAPSAEYLDQIDAALKCGTPYFVRNDDMKVATVNFMAKYGITPEDVLKQAAFDFLNQHR